MQRRRYWTLVAGAICLSILLGLSICSVGCSDPDKFPSVVKPKGDHPGNGDRLPSVVKPKGDDGDRLPSGVTIPMPWN